MEPVPGGRRERACLARSSTHRRVPGAGPGARRRNTLLAAAYDLKVFFGTVGRDPLEVSVADLLSFVKAQRRGSSSVVRISDGSSGRALSTIKRRLSTLSGFYAYLVATDRLARSPVLPGLATRASARRGRRGVPLVRSARLLPQILEPAEVSALLGALRRWRDRAMVLGGLRRSEVLGLRLEDLRPGERRVFVADDHRHPTRGILSPLLANIALSVFDEHFAEAWQAIGGRTSAAAIGGGARDWRPTGPFATRRLRRDSQRRPSPCRGNA